MYGNKGILFRFIVIFNIELHFSLRTFNTRKAKLLNIF